MTHDEARVLLSGYAAATLDLAEAADVRAHLASGCTDCLQELFSRPVGVVRAAAERPAAEQPATARGRHPAFAALVAGAVAAIGLALWMAGDLRRQEMRADRLAARVSRLARDRQRLASRVPRPTAAIVRPPTVSGAESTAPNGAAPDAGSNHRAAGLQEAADVEPRAPLVRYSPDVLSVRAANAPLDALLEQIGRESGVTIRGVPAARQISASFDRVPLPEALDRLLGEQNFVLVYDDQRRPRVVELLSGTTPPEPAAETSSPEPSASERAERSLEETVGLLVRHQSVPLGGTLAEALGKDAMPLEQLIDTGVHHADKAVRAAAMRASVEALEGDETLRSSVLGTLATLDDTALAELVRAMAGEHAEEALFYVATQSNGTLRVRAASLLQQLHLEEQGTPRADG